MNRSSDVVIVCCRGGTVAPGGRRSSARRHFTYCWPQKVGTFLPQSAVTAVLDNAHIAHSWHVPRNQNEMGLGRGSWQFDKLIALCKID
jgi:hypothetical protein